MEKAIAMRPAAAGRYGRYTSKMMIKSFKCVSLQNYILARLGVLTRITQTHASCILYYIREYIYNVTACLL